MRHARRLWSAGVLARMHTIDHTPAFVGNSRAVRAGTPALHRTAP